MSRYRRDDRTMRRTFRSIGSKSIEVSKSRYHRAVFVRITRAFELNNGIIHAK